jgi:hypothetical protein
MMEEKMSMKYSNTGIPILKLSEKIDALKSCMIIELNEDALGHLFDLINHIAPEWRFLGLQGIEELKNYYGKHPCPIEKD